MAALAGSLYLLSTAAFAIVALVVGVRLVLLWRRTRQSAELLLGLGLALTAALGYGVMMIGMVGRSTLPDPANAPAWFTWCTTAGWISHNIGVMCMLGFVVSVFRPGQTWARVLAALGVVVMWTGWGIYVAGGGMTDALPHGGYWIAFGVIGTYPMWSGTEAFLYYRQLKKRLAIGIGDRVVANRFLLWTLASATATASIWVVNIPSFLGVARGGEGAETLISTTTFATACFGIATVSFYWLTFFPPSWYRARLEAPTS